MTSEPEPSSWQRTSSGSSTLRPWSPGSHRAAAIGGALKKIFEVYEDFRIEPEEYVDAGDKVVIMTRNRARARGSGIEPDQSFVFVWTVRAGTLARLEVYANRHDALEAAGLSE